MKPIEQKTAAKQFAAYWATRGDEKQDTQSFWLSLLRTVYGVENPAQFIQFEVPVKLDHVSYIDGFISETKVLIEQKSASVDLNRGYKQSDGTFLRPYEQARRYAGFLPHDQNPRWIVVCNFQEFQIYDMNRPNDEPETLRLANLEKEYHRLQFLVDTGSTVVKKEMEVSLQAGEIVGTLYDALLKQYKDPESPETLKSLNALCVRLVFCLYAEDAGVFGGHGMFQRYLQNHTGDARRALIDLFRVLDTQPENRDPYIDEDLAAFPYVNGGLFADEDVVIPRLDENIVDLILHRASEDFDWSVISPTIFGAVFESTLNPETRRKGGMHYTSIENIHKVIGPLFLDDLRAELDDIKAIPVDKTRNKQLRQFQTKLAGLTFLDPACGSGNFLTETYLSLRRLENEVIDALLYGQVILGQVTDPIRVSIGQFYGIEINDFAVTVAKTALWIAESQMMQETEKLVRHTLDFLPLRSYANIVEGNALQMDWERVVPKRELDYIMGNPPFVGHQWRTKEQAVDLESVCKDIPKCGKLDYVCGWYVKAADYMQGTQIHAAFVSTNSISQGESVGILWKPLFTEKHLTIEFAYRTFVWTSEAKDKAAVHCVIVGFTCGTARNTCYLYESDRRRTVEHINGYLVDAPNVFIQSRGKPLTAGLPIMSKGSQPTDGGNLIFSVEERDDLIKKYPQTEELLRRYISADDYINNKIRYCLWLVNISPSKYRNIHPIMERLERVVKCRRQSPTSSVQRNAETPMLFTQIRQPQSQYLAMPEVSSQNRKYIPIGFLTPDIIASNKLYLVPNADLYMFGIMTSNVHMAWMRVIAGRLKSDYSYSPAVYNNFPWPTPTDEQKAKIEQTAQAILDARERYPDASLADLYDPATMPPELVKAHQQNDKAVMRAYGFDIKTTTESSCVAELMRRYQGLMEEA